jgi:hypothetical protein
MSKECSICYFEMDEIEKPFSCSNNECSTKVCRDCIISYIDFYSRENKSIPICPNTNCKSEILLSNLSHLNDEEAFKKYCKLCTVALLNNKKDDILEETNAKLFVKKIRDEKQKFIRQQYPKAIAYVIETCLQSKLKSIDKKNKEHLSKISTKSNKKCPDVLCYSGLLDIDYVCLSCSQKYCKTCEIKIKSEEDHICKQEDIDSLKEIEKFVKCPKCKLPVIRSYGCNHITCSICHTNFDYVTGKISSVGNHSNDVYVPKKYHKPSLSYSKKDVFDKDVFYKLVDIEEKEPTNYSFSNVLKDLKKYLETENTSLEYIIANNYDKYKTTLREKKNYFKHLKLIQSEIENDNININFLKKIERLI